MFPSMGGWLGNAVNLLVTRIFFNSSFFLMFVYFGDSVRAHMLWRVGDRGQREREYPKQVQHCQHRA